MINSFKKDFLLAPYTTYQIGGLADYFFIAKTKHDFINALEWTKTEHMPLTIIGGGSNVLISDSGVSGLVILNKTKQYRFESDCLISESGVSISRLARESIQQNLSGLDFATNIPGTIGGAIVGNAGASGKDISDSLISVLVWNTIHGLSVLDKIDLELSYRSSLLRETRDKVLLEAKFQLVKGDKEIMSKLSKIDLMKRCQNYRGQSCGSYFKNPIDTQILFKGKVIENPSAGLLIDSLGLKGLSVGGASISSYHANVIVNKKKASAGDIINLEEIIVKKVKDEYGIKLTPEVIKIGKYI